MRRHLRVYFDPNDWWVGYYRGDRHHYVGFLCAGITWRRRYPDGGGWAIDIDIPVDPSRFVMAKPGERLAELAARPICPDCGTPGVLESDRCGFLPGKIADTLHGIVAPSQQEIAKGIEARQIAVQMRDLAGWIRYAARTDRPARVLEAQRLQDDLSGWADRLDDTGCLP